MDVQNVEESIMNQRNEITCRRCGERVTWSRDYDPELSGKMGTFFYNDDGSMHKCEIKISVDYDYIKLLKLDNKILRCSIPYKLKYHKSLLHRIRHARREGLKIVEELERRLEWDRWKLELIEKLLEEQWHKLWNVPTHKYHYETIDYFFKWYKEYYETLYPQMYSIIESLSYISPYFSQSVLENRVTEPLRKFKENLEQILKIITLVRDVAISSATKSEKDYWLRQIRKAIEWRGIQVIQHSFNKKDYIVSFKLKEICPEMRRYIKEAYQDCYAKITNTSDHGWYTMGLTSMKYGMNWVFNNTICE